MIKNFRNAGFVLSELLIAVGISAFLVLAGMTLLASGVRAQTAWRAQSEISGQLLLMHDYFSQIVLNTGGNSLDLWSSIWVENNCAARAPYDDCDGSDRLWLATSVSDFSCRVIAVNAGLNEYTFDNTSGCCMTAVDLTKSHVSMVSNGTYAQLFVASRNTLSCTAVMVPGPMSAHDLNVSGVTPPNWIGALVTPVEISVYYLNRNTTELYLDKYRNGDDETKRDSLAIADQVFDFQVSLGLDHSPSDGILTDNKDASDEWLFNDPGLGESFGTGAFPVGSRTGLKAVSIGLLIGDRGVGLPVDRRVLDGPVRNAMAGWINQSTISVHNLRNSTTFQ